MHSDTSSNPNSPERVESQPATPARKSSGLPWFTWHAWLGYKLSILMFAICLTGTIATVSNELDWLLNPMLRIAVQDGPDQYAAMVENFRSEFPDATLSYIDAPLYNNYAAIGSMTASDGSLHRVFFDQYTGEITGVLPWAASAQRFLRDLHRFLLFPVSFGAYLVSFFGFVLLASVVSAFFVYKKWWQGFFKLRLHKGKRIFYGDLHRLLGVWSLWFLLIIAVTGVWYFVERAARDLDVDIVEPLNSVRLSAGSSTSSDFISADAAIAIAKDAVPGLEIRYVFLPGIRGETLQPYSIAGRTDEVLARADANQVHVHPVTGEVTMVHLARGAPVGRQINSLMDPLHFGSFGGLATKLLYFVFGLASLAMTLTGAWMWLRRNRLRETKGLQYSFMGVWKEASALLLVVGLSWGFYKILFFGSLFA